MSLLWLTACCLFLVFGPGRWHAEATFGVEKTVEGCEADHREYDGKYLSGEWEPFFATGPPPECDTEGCLDGFWAPMSRFQVEPTCPKNLVYDLTAQLRKLHEEGSWWAEKALTLQPCDLWQVLKGRTTWVVGDSVTEDIGHAMAQMMLEYWDKKNWNQSVSPDPNMATALNHGASEGAKHMGKRVPYWCFQMGNENTPGRICYVKADLAKRSIHVINLMPRLAHEDDIILVNIGIHYNDMFFLSEDMTMLGYALTQPGLPKNVFWMESGPQHYDTPTGIFDMSRPIIEQRCRAAGKGYWTELVTFPNGELGVKPGANYSDIKDTRDVPFLHRLIAGGERNLATQPIVDALGIPTLRSWNITLPLHQFHTHLHNEWETGECKDIPCDCTHSCHPGHQQLLLVHFVELVNAHAAKMHSRHGGSQ